MLKTAKPGRPLSDIIHIPPKPYQSTNVEIDSITELEHYIPSASTLDIVDHLSAGLREKGGKMLSITGPYGSGKSTMAVFLKGIVSAVNSREWHSAYKTLKREPEQYAKSLLLARKKANIHEKGIILCSVMARKEPVPVTIMRALHCGLYSYFGKDLRGMKDAWMFYECLSTNDAGKIVKLVESVSRQAPVLIMIDEFGKNIEYFATDESDGDLFLLQELAEMGRRVPLSIMTLQHMAFDEYAAGASDKQKKEWAKIQGRFEDIPFANSPEQTRQLISNTIRIRPPKDGAHHKTVMRWAKKESRNMQDMGLGTGFDPGLVASCYPLSPVSLEVIPELCSRYGQHERTLLSFISDHKKHTVSTFISENHWDEKHPPRMDLDMLYDFFISGTAMIHSSSQNITRLMEIETIVRDAHGLTDAEKKTLKTIGVLNLVGRSGYLRASRRIIEYSVGSEANQTLRSLEKRSIITYRRHADEYRIWHGTDIDIAAKMDAYRSRLQNITLPNLLRMVVRLEPVMAARHSIKTGTMRLFGREFTLSPVDKNVDGTILYTTSEKVGPDKTFEDLVKDHREMDRDEKPVIIVVAGDTTDLKLAAVEFAAIRDILQSENEVTADWVARKELKERLADAEVALDREFANAYGRTARWSYKGKKMEGTPSSIASQVCDMAYPQTPVIRNEMINRTNLSAQGSTAKKSLLEAMILRPEKAKFGIKGNGPDRAIYEAVFYQNKIHVMGSSFGWRFANPKKTSSLRPVWKAMLGAIKKRRTTLTEIYESVKKPPYGARDGPLQFVFLAMAIMYRDNIAVYEHGTFVPRLQPEIAERMTKNPGHFDVKYFANSSKNAALIENAASELGIKRATMLDVVGYLVRTVAALPPYVKKTKQLDRNTTAVRDAVLAAVEPDTLLFESLPSTMGFGAISGNQAGRFAKKLAKSVRTLQNTLPSMFGEIGTRLFETTGIHERAKISEAAGRIMPHVTDQKMKVFLGALSADVLEKDDDWISYIAMSLTDVPPTDWVDEQRTMFENNLAEFAAGFRRLASLHFSHVSGSFAKPSYQVTVTRADGSERHTIVSLSPESRKKVEAFCRRLKKDMKGTKFTDGEMAALGAMLSGSS